MKNARTFMLVAMWLAVGGIVGVAQAQTRRLLFEETKIEGKVRKPEVIMFISRQNLNTDYSLELRESFLPRILESVERAPF